MVRDKVHRLVSLHGWKSTPKKTGRIASTLLVVHLWSQNQNQRRQYTLDGTVELSKDRCQSELV